jgi:tetratricopeptide (TPR) repeat protein
LAILGKLALQFAEKARDGLRSLVAINPKPTADAPISEGEAPEVADNALIRFLSEQLDRSKSARLDDEMYVQFLRDSDSFSGDTYSRRIRSFALYVGGEICFAAARYDEAALRLRRSLVFDPYRYVAWEALWLTLWEAEQHDVAYQLAYQATYVFRGAMSAYNVCGLYCLKYGGVAMAKGFFSTGLSFSPNKPQIINNLGLCEKVVGNTDVAYKRFSEAVGYLPSFVNARINALQAAIELGYVDEAKVLIDYFESSYESIPKEYKAPLAYAAEMVGYDHLAKSLAGELEVAFNDDVEGLVTQVQLLVANGKTSEALAKCEAAHRANLEDKRVLSLYSETLLGAGQFDRGWQLYDARIGLAFKAPTEAAMSQVVVWDGNPFEGTLVILSEQGIGDMILFAGWFAATFKLARRIVLQVPDKLLGLFARSFPTAYVIPVSVDWMANAEIGVLKYCFAGSVPALVGHERHSGSVPYLVPDTACVEVVKKSIVNGRHSVGLCWRGGLVKTAHVQRSVSAHDLIDKVSKYGRSAYSLQYQLPHWPQEIVADERLCVLPAPIDVNDIEWAAACVAAMDYVVTVTGTIAHLCGALGKAAKVLVPFKTTWRYQFQSKVVPWYPSLILARQKKPGQWADAIDCLVSEWK